jgi:hypothetical protein
MAMHRVQGVLSVHESLPSRTAFAGIAAFNTAQEKLLFCDGCDGGTHMDCLMPKLTEAPSGMWFCTLCRGVYACSWIYTAKHFLMLIENGIGTDFKSSKPRPATGAITEHTN